MFDVQLNPGPNGPRRALLREPSGLDESFCVREDPVLASELIGRLLVVVESDPSLQKDVWSLSIAERDRLVAELYSRCYGDNIDAVVSCGGCNKTFSLGFSLAGLVANRSEMTPERATITGPDEQGVYHLQDGSSFRLPTAGDERFLRGTAPARSARALLERCVKSGDVEGSAEQVQQAMELVAPVLSLDLPTTCPLCGHEQEVPFDLVGFFMAALLRERPLLFREVHCLARAYRWSHAEILALPRTERRAYVALVLQEYEAQRGGAFS